MIMEDRRGQTPLEAVLAVVRVCFPKKDAYAPAGYRSGSPELLLRVVCTAHSSWSTKLAPHRATGSKAFRRERPL
jgi:hypothetical protein